MGALIAHKHGQVAPGYFRFRRKSIKRLHILEFGHIEVKLKNAQPLITDRNQVDQFVVQHCPVFDPDAKQGIRYGIGRCFLACFGKLDFELHHGCNR